MLILSCWLNHVVNSPNLIDPPFPPLFYFHPPFSSTLSFLASLFSLFFGCFFGRVARKAAVGTVDGGVLSRLLTPTQASLARSKSAAALSAEGTNAPGNLGDPDGEKGWLDKDPGAP